MYTHIFNKEKVLIEVHKNNILKNFEGCLHNKDIVVNKPKEILKYLDINVTENENIYNISKGEFKASLNKITCKVKTSTMTIDSIYFKDLKTFLESAGQASLYKIETENSVRPVNSGDYYATCKIYVGILYKETAFLNKNVKDFGDIQVTLNDLNKIGWTQIHCGYIEVANKKVSLPSYADINVTITEKVGQNKSDYDVQEDLNFKFNPDPQITRLYRNLEQQDVYNLNKCLKLAKVDSKEKLYLFLSQINSESNELEKVVEMGGDSKTKATRNSVKSYFNKKPYGYKYRGSGTIQLTHWYNYSELEKFIGDDKIYKVTSGNREGSHITGGDEGCEYVAFTYPWLVAGFFWKKNNISGELDKFKTIEAKVEKLTRIINGSEATQATINKRMEEFKNIKKSLE